MKQKNQVFHRLLVKKFISFIQENIILNPNFVFTPGLEKLINPFMRVEKESVQKVTKTIGDPIETMRVLREMKNNFQ